jgi:hypothetical protein
MHFRPLWALLSLLLTARALPAQELTPAPPEIPFTLAPADSAKLAMIERIFSRLEARVEEHPEVSELLDLGNAMGNPWLAFEGFAIESAPDSTLQELIGLTRDYFTHPGLDLCGAFGRAMADTARAEEIIVSSLLAPVDSLRVERWADWALELMEWHAAGAEAVPAPDSARSAMLAREFFTGLGPEGERAIGAAVMAAMLGDMTGACDMGRRIGQHFFSLPPATQVEMLRAASSYGSRMKPMPPTGMPGEEEEDVEPAPGAEAGAAGKLENFPGV